jgi:beta-lactamase regulating signal transducer with metallopeptidase domain
LAHEFSHGRRRDPLRQMIGSIAMRGLFFVPMLIDVARAARVSNEVAADAAAVARFGHAQLIGALRTVLRATPVVPPGVTAMVTSEMLTERVQALSGEYPKLAIRRLRLTLSGVALILLLGLGLAVPSASQAPVVLLPVHRVVASPR